MSLTYSNYKRIEVLKKIDTELAKVGLFTSQFRTILEQYSREYTLKGIAVITFDDPDRFLNYQSNWYWANIQGQMSRYNAQDWDVESKQVTAYFDNGIIKVCIYNPLEGSFEEEIDFFRLYETDTLPAPNPPYPEETLQPVDDRQQARNYIAMKRLIAEQVTDHNGSVDYTLAAMLLKYPELQKITITARETSNSVTNNCWGGTEDYVEAMGANVDIPIAAVDILKRMQENTYHNEEAFDAVLYGIARYKAIDSFEFVDSIDSSEVHTYKNNLRNVSYSFANRVEEDLDEELNFE